MALTEEQKKKIEEEEAYRAELRGSPKKKKGIGCLGWLGIAFLVAIVISAMASSSGSSTQSENSGADSKSNTADQKQIEEQRLRQLADISTLFCSERSKPDIRSVNFADFIAMYEADGKTVTLKPANGAYPTKENCQKVADICLKMWNADDCKNIAGRKIWIGMTENQLILSWGLPNDRNNSTYAFGVHSQWVYGTFGSYVYLEGKDKTDMKVTSWQD